MLEPFALRRLAVPDLRPRRRRASSGGRRRYVVRARRLTLEHEGTICSLAAEFGVSHETVRTEWRRCGAASAPE